MVIVGHSRGIQGVAATPERWLRLARVLEVTVTELTPEERDRIYQEEKARHEARQRLAEQDAEAKKKSKFGWGKYFLWVIGVVVAIQAIAYGSASYKAALAPEEPSAPPPRVATLDKSEAKQAERHKLIQQLITQGIFSKVEQPSSLPHVYVRRAFYELDIDTKKSFLGVVYAYYFDGSDPSSALVRIFDARTGKQVGTFSQLGLRIDE